MWDDELRLFGARNLKQLLPHARIFGRPSAGIFANRGPDPLAGALRLFNFLKQSVSLVGLHQRGGFKNFADDRAVLRTGESISVARKVAGMGYPLVGHAPSSHCSPPC